MMLLLAGFLILQTIAPARDETAEARAFVEVRAPEGDVYAGERIPLRVVFGIERDFLEHRMVQPFGPRLDVPVQIAWTGVDLPEAGTAGATFAWNEVVRKATQGEDRVVSGRTYRTYSVDARFSADAPGPRAVAAPTIAYAYATRFEDGFLSGTTPADRVDAFAAGRGVELRILPLPEAGRPPEFGGAVGSFTVEAEASPREIDLDRSLRLVVRIRGDGNLETFDAPRWKEIGGFRVLGLVDQATSTERRFELDLAPTSDAVKQIPAIPFAYFEPGEKAGYRLARTGPIDVVVRRTARAAAAPSAIEPPRSSDKESRTGWWIAAALAVLGSAVLVGRSRRIRTPAP
jgi:hypothetical protein